MPTSSISMGHITKFWAQDRSDLLCHFLEQVDSTNSFSKTLPPTQQNQLIVSDFQSQGRGRGSHTWLSPEKGTALLSSWIFQLNFFPQPILAPLVGLALFSKISSEFSLPNTSLKAPNDIFIFSKKVAGILIEIESMGDQTRLIIGIGINFFDSPPIESSTYIHAHNPDIRETHIRNFLSEFYKELKKVIRYSKNSDLNLEQREGLLSALNSNPNLKEPFIKIHPNGSLETRSLITSWTTL